MSKLDAYSTENYEVYILSDEEKEYLKGYSLQAAATEGILPNEYGIRNKVTGVTEMYCANMAACLSVINNLEEGVASEMERLKERNKQKAKTNLRSV
ncbi:MAG: hypothetical protein OQK78_07015 [Gammaproteobacteria bacterium]|nr:hypothetical protein [Gammaproteobacteria bacterium]MCW8887955.1 hypothetical protein [Gammaproteobacteria bacterium]